MKSEITPIWLEKNGKKVAAEIHGGFYVGTDGKEHYDQGSIYLDSGECYQAFGEAYPFGTANGAEIAYYVKKGATIRLREAHHETDGVTNKN